jgi:hypothetical protein
MDEVYTSLRQLRVAEVDTCAPQMEMVIYYVHCHCTGLQGIIDKEPYIELIGVVGRTPIRPHLQHPPSPRIKNTTTKKNNNSILTAEMQLMPLFEILIVLLIQGAALQTRADPFDCSKAGSDFQRHFTKPICVKILSGRQPLHPGGAGPLKYFQISR